jgi:hypothetical protein
MSSQREPGIGCGTLIAFIILLGLVLAAVISVAALVDPFSWVPPLGDIFQKCTDNPDTPSDDCDLGTRYPGFWSHVAVNFAYVLIAAGLLIALALTLPEFRRARTARFDSHAAVERYRRSRQQLVLLAVLLAVLGAVPIIAALA